MAIRSLWPIALAGLTCAACTEAAPTIESTQRLGATSDIVGPYAVHSVITDILDGDVVELRYAINDETAFTAIEMIEDGDNPERFRAEIPGQPAGSAIGYYVTIIRDGERVADDPLAGAAGPYRFEVLGGE